MALLGKTLNLVTAAALSILGHGFVTAAMAQANATDQVVLGKTITRDDKIAALVPARFNGTLRVVTMGPVPPFTYLDGKNELTGINIDVSRALAAKMGVGLTWDMVQLEGVIPGMQARKYDVAAANLGDTVEREKILNFINYQAMGNVVIVPETDTTSHELMDLCGKTVSRSSGDVFGKFIDELQPKCEAAGKGQVNVKTMPDINAAFLALKSGGADAQINSLPMAERLIASEGNVGKFRLLKPDNSPQGWNPNQGGTQVLKAETELAGAIEAATRALMADGTLKAIATHYGLPAIVLDDVVVNRHASGK